jgi:oxidase EvaA
MCHRNMIVEVGDDIACHDGFFWLTFGQLYALLQRGKMLSAGLRSLLSLLPADNAGGRVSDGDPFVRALRASGGGDHAYWSQPMIELRGLGLAAFVVKEFDGVLHVLARASMESGLRDSVEIGPTVHCQPKEFERDVNLQRPLLLDYVLDADDDLVRYNVVHTGDGEVFFHADCRYVIVEADENLPTDLPGEYAWIALGQLSSLIQQGNRVTTPARTLYACLNSLHQSIGEDGR